MEMKKFEVNGLYWCDIRTGETLDEKKWVRTVARVTKKTPKTVVLEIKDCPVYDGYRGKVEIDDLTDTEMVWTYNFTMYAYNPVQ